jgi:uncharacterized membrane protein
MSATASPISTQPFTPSAVSGVVTFVRARLHWLYLAYALPAIVFLSIVTPPFQVADEFAHAMRADQILRGKLVSDRLGGKVHGDLARFGEPYRELWFHPEVKQTVERAERSGRIVWSGSVRKFNFQNTAQYGPFLYLPQALGIRLGRLLGLTVPQSVLLARLVNGLTACLIGFAAIAICRRGRALMFATLLLPMTLSEFASLSQDALLISLSLVAVALASRVVAEGRTATMAEFMVFATIVVATTYARLPQFALGLFAPALVVRRDPHWRGKLATLACAAGFIAIWMNVLRTLIPPMPHDLSVSGQLAYVVTHPLALPTVMLNTFEIKGAWLWGTTIGRLGWLDTPMPVWYVAAASVALAFAVIAPGNKGPVLRPTIIAAVTFVGLLSAVCLSLYVSWTRVGKPVIDGLQGRYILPILPLLAWPVPTYRPRVEGVANWAWYTVILFPIVTLAALPPTLMSRYYGSWPVLTASLQALLLP